MKGTKVKTFHSISSSFICPLLQASRDTSLHFFLTTPHSQTEKEKPNATSITINAFASVECYLFNGNEKNAKANKITFRRRNGV